MAYQSLLTNDQLSQLLMQSGVVKPQDLQAAQTYALNSEVALEDAVIEKSVVTDEVLGALMAKALQMPFVSLSKLSIPETIFHIIPEAVARRQNTIAFDRTKDGVKVATTNPKNIEFFNLLTQKTGEKVIPYLSTHRDIQNAYRIYRKDLQKAYAMLVQEEGDDGQMLDIEPPVARIVDMIIEYAAQDKVSDIHIEPQEKSALVRFRIDGILHDMLTVSREIHDRIVTRLKVLSKLRTDEHMAPQDGKIRMKLDDGDLDLRVSILPMTEGEKVVMRLLSSHMSQLSLSDLGINASDLKKIERAYSKSFGMILSTGPTGSGKTSTIYSILKILNTREKNITTIEDPVEYRIRGVNQIQVNAKANLTFASGLRSILRQDPNIVFVGEIRDNETAGIAVNAALTGHLVLSTLHTNDAATALPRLIDMSIEPFLVASTVNVIIAQRLVRRICESCRISYLVTEQELAQRLPPETIAKHYVLTGASKQVRFYKGQGCKICHFTGYKGRIGVYEVLEITPSIRKLIIEKQDSDAIVRTAVSEGMATMLDDGLEKISRGVTSLEEVLRVTKVESGETEQVQPVGA